MSLEEVVHAQINEILEKAWPQCTCEDIPTPKIVDMMAKGVIPGYSIISCTNCGRQGIVVFQHERWSLISAT